MVRRIAARLVMLACLATLAACDRSLSPADRSVTVRLVSPHADDAAALIELTGQVGEISADSGMVVFTETIGDITRVMILRNSPGPIAFDVRLPDPSRRPTARLLEVADGSNEPRETLGAYRVEF